MVKIMELIDEFRVDQQIQARKPRYIDLCMYRLKLWATYLNDEYEITEIEEVKQLHIKNYIRYRQQLGKEKAITINGHIATLRVLFNFLIDEEFITELNSPMRRIKNLKEEKTVIRTFTDAEVKRIIKAVPEETYSNIRDKLILIMLFDTGIRVSELCHIKEADVSARNILINGKGSKQRLIYISKIMRRYMRKFEVAKKIRFQHKYPEEIQDYYFLDQCAEGLYRSTINKILKKYCEVANVRKEVRCSPHDCRHYFAQKQLRNGLDIYSLSRLLGHYDTQITANYLKGLDQETILELGKVKSPLNMVQV
ncbi:tyrosine-type recombinase/integrase [Solibacillus sp. FSL W8-0474]|uniref:tyrosine-type recombinase/integrase n=1 Tax=Solibacillus sp. FSL W8-0474 TaxID=2975336 RepID=UPI0030F50208